MSKGCFFFPRLMWRLFRLRRGEMECYPDTFRGKALPPSDGCEIRRGFASRTPVKLAFLAAPWSALEYKEVFPAAPQTIQNSRQLTPLAALFSRFPPRIFKVPSSSELPLARESFVSLVDLIEAGFCGDELQQAFL